MDIKDRELARWLEFFTQFAEAQFEEIRAKGRSAGVNLGIIIIINQERQQDVVPFVRFCLVTSAADHSEGLPYTLKLFEESDVTPDPKGIFFAQYQDEYPFPYTVSPKTIPTDLVGEGAYNYEIYDPNVDECSFTLFLDEVMHEQLDTFTNGAAHGLQDFRYGLN